MIQLNRVLLLLVSAMAMLAGNLRADNSTPVATPQVTPAAVSATPAAKAAPKALSPLRAANALLDAGKIDEAIAAYEKMGVQKSKKAETWRLNNEALAYLQANPPAPDKAVPLLQGSVAADPNNYVAWNNLGSAYEQTDALDKAKDAYQKSIDAATAAGASTTKAENNLKGCQEKLDKIAGNSGDNSTSTPVASTTPDASAAPAAGNTPVATGK
jgi:tetratricopeptide (TPR) repeat protein